MVFDTTRLSTFEAVKHWKKSLDENVQLPNGKPIPVVLLANKVCLLTLASFPVFPFIKHRESLRTKLLSP